MNYFEIREIENDTNIYLSQTKCSNLAEVR